MKRNWIQRIATWAALASGFCAAGILAAGLWARGSEADAATAHASPVRALSNGGRSPAAEVDAKAPVAKKLFSRNEGAAGGAMAARWDAKAAEGYLDQRIAWWRGWDRAKRDQGTYCVSCHTVLPYTLARPALRKLNGEQVVGEDERLILDNVLTRVRLWKDLAPVYSDEKYGKNKGVESRGTESVLLAFVMANRDAQSGKLSADGRAALEHLWEQQQKDGERKGAWLWQMFGLNPWEGDISPYYGAALAAVAVGTAPENYRATPEIQNNIKMLGEYLDREYAAQPLLNRMMLLWAAAKMPGLVTPDRQKAIADEILTKQREDGGWNLFQLATPMTDADVMTLLGRFKRLDGTPQDTASDGLATGFAVFVLEQIGVSPQFAQVKRGREWLEKNQNKTDGSWMTYSINKKRELTSDAGRFMSDAATAYAVLALAD